MKRLLDLQLSIPSIDELTSRKLMGGDGYVPENDLNNALPEFENDDTVEINIEDDIIITGEYPGVPNAPETEYDIPEPDMEMVPVENDQPDPDNGPDFENENYDQDDQDFEKSDQEYDQDRGTSENGLDPRIEQLNNSITQITAILNGKAINISDYNIRLATTMCGSNARTLVDNTIEVSNEFFTYDYNDQASIIWHEIYHVANNHSKSSNVIKLDKDNIILLSPDERISECLNTFINWKYGELGLNSNYMQDLKNDVLTITEIRGAEWYENEIITHKAELNNRIEKSEHYQAELEFMLWRHEQTLNYIRNQNK